MKFRATVIVLLFITGCTTLAPPDTPEERAKAVESYFREISMRDLMTDMVKEVSKRMPPEQRDAFENTMLKNVRLEILETAAKESLARHLTVSEINAFTDFMRRPEGKSAMNKMKYYMADLMPVIQQELVRAIKLSGPPKLSEPPRK